MKNPLKHPRIHIHVILIALVAYLYWVGPIAESVP